jgi:alanine dehydrogenase
MTPAGVEVMIHNGHTVLVEKNAGRQRLCRRGLHQIRGQNDRHAQRDFRCGRHGHACQRTLAPEYDLIRDGQIVFTYLHLAADETQTRMH